MGKHSKMGDGCEKRNKCKKKRRKHCAKRGLLGNKKKKKDYEIDYKKKNKYSKLLKSGVCKEKLYESSSDESYSYYSYSS